MADVDVVRDLPDGRIGIEYDSFRTLIPNWSEWMRVGSHPKSGSPEHGIVFHTRYEGRRFAIVTPADVTRESDLKITLYGITDGMFSFSWTSLRTFHEANAAELPHRIREMRGDLPNLLGDCYLSRLGNDGEVDEYDRQYEGAQLKFKPYYQWDETWDHDHCVYCTATFSLDDPGALTEGYAIQGTAQGDDYHWICKSCVDVRKGIVEFKIVEDAEK
jgi:hypothetical protein